LRFPLSRPIHVHDIAVSSAITSVELFRRLSEIRTVTMKASDYHNAILRVRAFGIDCIFDVDRAPLQIAVRKTGMSMRRGPWCYLLAPFWPLARRRLDSAQRISLFHPEAHRLAATNPEFRLIQEDFFRPSTERFDVVRLANALWPSHTLEQIKRSIKAVTETVAEGGLLIVGHAGDFSILGRQDGRFSQVAILGSGHEHADIIHSIGT
jgi:hypothetical protein